MLNHEQLLKLIREKVEHPATPRELLQRLKIPREERLENLEEEFTLRGHSTGTLNPECPRPPISLVGDLYITRFSKDWAASNPECPLGTRKTRAVAPKLAGTFNRECPL